MSYCYGCGRLNEKGLRVKSYWDGEIAVCTFQPHPYHTAFGDYVYGGLIASVIDCHSTGTAAAAAYKAENRSMDSIPSLRYVTGSLHVDYHKPTYINSPMHLRSTIEEITSKKVIVLTELYSKEIITVKARIVAIKMPDSL